MEPDEVAKSYLKQSEALEKFLSDLTEDKYSKAELFLIVRVLCEKYYELLINLATYTPLLSAHKVKFYRIAELELKLNLDEPPFEKDFFTRED
jgi:hypothetical protein